MIKNIETGNNHISGTDRRRIEALTQAGRSNKEIVAINSYKDTHWSYFPKGRRPFISPCALLIAVKNLTRDPENAWALHLLTLTSFLNLGGCTSELNLPLF